MPLVTLIGLDLLLLFSGALFTETIFSWPGMGRLFYQSAMRRDYTVPRITGHGPTLYQSGRPSTRRLELVSAKPLSNGAVAMHYRRAR